MKTRPPMVRDEHSNKYGMSLPQGKTCQDCVHFARCVAIFGHQADDEVCDWAPSRFHERRPLPVITNGGMDA